MSLYAPKQRSAYAIQLSSSRGRIPAAIPNPSAHATVGQVPVSSTASAVDMEPHSLRSLGLMASICSSAAKQSHIENRSYSVGSHSK